MCMLPSGDKWFYFNCLCICDCFLWVELVPLWFTQSSEGHIYQIHDNLLAIWILYNKTLSFPCVSDLKKSPLFGNGYQYPPHLAHLHVHAHGSPGNNELCHGQPPRSVDTRSCWTTLRRGIRQLPTYLLQGNRSRGLFGCNGDRR